MKRREFLKGSVVATTGLFGFPTVVSSAAVARSSPNDKINIAQIGYGRYGQTDVRETIRNTDMCRFVAIADVDINRANIGKRWIENYYKQRTGNSNYIDINVYQDYREMIRNEDIDAVVISTPDHWHARPAIEAAMLGKDIFIQKPAAVTFEHSRAMSDVIHRMGRIFQIGTQQRASDPWPQFKWVCELVRNGAIGKLKHVEVGLPTDPAGEDWPQEPVPENLDYDMWLGYTPVKPYTERRVHPQDGFSRPGWLRIEEYCAGMITGWGSHHIDIAHWGMGTEYTGPIELEGTAEFPKSGLWTVHGPYDVRSTYANGVTLHVSNKHPNGIRFEGEDGWIFVSRGQARATQDDPITDAEDDRTLRVSDPKILQTTIGPNDTHLYESPEIHKDWLQSVRSRRPGATNVELAHRSTSACILNQIAMHLPRKLRWDPVRERFIDDDEANAMLSRPERMPYGIAHIDI